MGWLATKLCSFNTTRVIIKQCDKMDNEKKNKKEQKKGIILPQSIVVLVSLILIVTIALVVYLVLNHIGIGYIDVAISTENWFSFLVSLIGICATFIVGFQIYNAIDMRAKTEELTHQIEKTESKIVELSEFQDKFNIFKYELDQNSKELAGAFEAIAEFFLHQGKTTEAIIYKLHALSQLPDSISIDYIRRSLNALLELLPTTPMEFNENITAITAKHILNLRNRTSDRVTQILAKELEDADKEMTELKYQVNSLWASCVTYLQYIIDNKKTKIKTT